VKRDATEDGSLFYTRSIRVAATNQTTHLFFKGEPYMLQQTDQIPGNFALNNSAFPNEEWVINRRYPGYPVYGLFAYSQAYRRFRDDIAAVGWKYFRMNNAVSDNDIDMFIQDGVEASLHPAAGVDYEDYDTDEDFLSAVGDRVVANMLRWERYVKYVHIWNEPNFQYLIAGNTSGIMDELQTRRADLYGKLMIRFATIMKNWPDVQIIGFDTGRAQSGSSDFIQEVYRLHPETHKLYDILGTHPGVDPVGPEMDNVQKWGSYSMSQNLKDIRQILRRQQRVHRVRRKGNWFTESGWPQQNGLFPGTTGREIPTLLQAAYYCRYYAMALRLAVDRVAPFFIEDVGGLNSGFFNRATREWRPSAFAVQNMIKLMPNPKLINVVHDGPNLFGYQIQPNALDAVAPITMYWNVAGPREINFPSPAFQVDMLGNTQFSKSAIVGPYPIYVQ
jgi:hypothetical protein